MGLNFQDFWLDVTTGIIPTWNTDLLLIFRKCVRSVCLYDLLLGYPGLISSITLTCVQWFPAHQSHSSHLVSWVYIPLFLVLSLLACCGSGRYCCCCLDVHGFHCVFSILLLPEVYFGLDPVDFSVGFNARLKYWTQLINFLHLIRPFWVLRFGPTCEAVCNKMSTIQYNIGLGSQDEVKLSY